MDFDWVVLGWVWLGLNYLFSGFGETKYTAVDSDDLQSLRDIILLVLHLAKPKKRMIEKEKNSHMYYRSCDKKQRASGQKGIYISKYPTSWVILTWRGLASGQDGW